MTEYPENFCLKWNDYQQNIISSFQKLRSLVEFSDVTLICEDDQQIEAHKIILSILQNNFKEELACSPIN